MGKPEIIRPWAVDPFAIMFNQPQVFLNAAGGGVKASDYIFMPEAMALIEFSGLYGPWSCLWSVHFLMGGLSTSGFAESSMANGISVSDSREDRNMIYCSGVVLYQAYAQCR